MIKKIWVVFGLDPSVSGFSSSGVEYDTSSFVLSNYSENFKNKKQAEKYVYETMKDYKKRGVGKQCKYIIAQIYCYSEDRILKK